MNSCDKTSVRKALGSGKWFSADKSSLINEIDNYINNVINKININNKIVGCLCPHAGYAYSGQTAAYSIAALKKDSEKHGKPEVIFIIGFSHSSSFNYASVMDGKGIQTAINFTEFDFESIEMFCKGRNGIKCFYNNHYKEHSAENQIPFVQRVFPDTKIVVVLVGTHDVNVYNQVSDGLVEVSKNKKLYVIASTDMLHDADHQLVQKIDEETIKLTESMDIKSLLNKWNFSNQIYCGISAVIPTMIYCKAIGCEKAITLELTNSEIVTKKKNSGWVVGYCSVIFVI